MHELETELTVAAELLPKEYVRFTNSRYPLDPPLKAEDECPDIPVVVEYDPGWYTPAKITGPPETCYPSEGEDPEVLAINIADESYEGPTLIDPASLPPEVLDKIIQQCWDDQQRHADYYDVAD